MLCMLSSCVLHSLRLRAIGRNVAEKYIISSVAEMPLGPRPYRQQAHQIMSKAKFNIWSKSKLLRPKTREPGTKV